MILSIGEILADLIGEKHDDRIDFKTYAGGAPFNVACNAKFAGAKVGFYGNVGRDVIGRFLNGFVQSIGLDYAKITEDAGRNTTLAFVTVDDEGERRFSFYRNNTADYALDLDAVDLDALPELKIVHLGSLMLSEEEGVRFARALVEKVKSKGILFSFDVNFRLDLFNSLSEAIERYKWFVDRADILKFSDDELLLYTGENCLDKAIEKIPVNNRLFALTMGKKGSMALMNNIKATVPTKVVRPVDTTGAGDAFFGALLAKIDEVGLKNLNEKSLTSIFEYCNKVASFAVTKFGAINSFDI